MQIHFRIEYGKEVHLPPLWAQVSGTSANGNYSAFYFLKNRELVLPILLSPDVEVGLAFNRRSVNVFEQTKRRQQRKSTDVGEKKRKKEKERGSMANNM